MPALPVIDEHARFVPAPPPAVWAALVRTIGGLSGERLPAPVATLWRFEPSRRRGGWPDAVTVGDAVLGFLVTEVDPPRLLRLAGRERLAVYELLLTLEPVGRTGDPDAGTNLRARTSARFPGLLGRVYKAALLRSGGHVVAVWLMLWRIDRRARHHP